ncbi:MAG TPA: DUF3995 domain-containing protein [Thermoanaerobaculia bacterium]|jgi:hypothetical protein|nr:DUF3995 domain-containing protein [Thermoanaerobaculia bacterium]
MNSLASFAGPAVVAVLVALSLLHVYWGFGGRLAWLSALPEVESRPLFVPTAAQSFAVAAGLALAALVLAGAAGWIAVPVSNGLLRIGSYGVATVFALRAIGEFRHVGFFKRNRGTRFARMDSLLYSPLCVLIAAGALLVARAV